jgi:integrase
VRGSIQKKGKTYYAVIALNGRRKWFRGPTKKDAQRSLTEKLNEIDNKTYREIPEISFNDFSELWLRDYAEVSVKPSTLTGYKDIIKRLLKPSIGNCNLTDITTGQLQAYVADRKKSVSGKTVCNEIVVIKEIFKHASRWGYLRINPAEYVERPKTTKPEIEILTPEEVEKFLSKADNHYRVAFLTDVLTGLRAGELWGLKWIDIDWNSKQIHVRRSLWKGQFQTPKSKYSIRKADIPDSLIQELKRWKLSCPVNEHDVVFPSPEGKLSQHDNTVKRYFNRALREAGLRQVSFHSLRHSNASIRIASGQNIKYIQSQLGHASINITLDIYGHLFNDANFNRHQVELLETSFRSVRNPLEKQAKDESDSLVITAPINHLQVVANA